MRAHFSIKSGFSLAEVLIALAILGVIAVFTIPKLLIGQQNAMFNAVTKEAASSFAASFQKMAAQGAITKATKPADILANINYVQKITTSVDGSPGSGSASCASGTVCYQLHSGAVIRTGSCSFGGTSNLNQVNIVVDPDGVDTGKQDSVAFFLYYNGQITTFGTAPVGSTNSCTAPSDVPDPTKDPSWFSWN